MLQNQPLLLGACTFAITLALGCNDTMDRQRSPSNNGGNSSGGSNSGGSSSGGTAATGGSGSGSGGASNNSGGNQSLATGGAASNGQRDYGPEKAQFLGNARCTGAGLLLCEDFEGANIDTGKWKIENSAGNTLELTTSQAARGSKSLHIVANNGFGYVRTQGTFPAADLYWGRMFIRVKRFSTIAWAHWTMAEAVGQGDGSKIRVGGQYNTNQIKNRWGVGSDGGPTGDWTTHDNDPGGAPAEPAVGEWVCLEWLHDGKTDETRFFVDAVEHPSLATTKNQHGGNNAPYVMPKFESVWFGWWQYQQDPTAFEVWVDELAVDDERVGCKL